MGRLRGEIIQWFISHVCCRNDKFVRHDYLGDQFNHYACCGERSRRSLPKTGSCHAAFCSQPDSFTSAGKRPCLLYCSYGRLKHELFSAHLEAIDLPEQKLFLKSSFLCTRRESSISVFNFLCLCCRTALISYTTSDVARSTKASRHAQIVLMESRVVVAAQQGRRWHVQKIRPTFCTASRSMGLGVN